MGVTVQRKMFASPSCKVLHLPFTTGMRKQSLQISSSSQLTVLQNSKHNIEMKSFSLQESNADLPSEYWQIQKLVKYLKVCIMPFGILFSWVGRGEVVQESCSSAVSLLPCRDIRNKA